MYGDAFLTVISYSHYGANLPNSGCDMKRQIRTPVRISPRLDHPATFSAMCGPYALGGIAMPILIISIGLLAVISGIFVGKHD